MSFSELRLLFDLMCDQLEADAEQHILRFESAYGFEFSKGVVMVFVFHELVMVCRFMVADLVYTSAFSKVGSSADECLDMMNGIRDWNGNFSNMFR